jgi:aminoglycoside phosphotransferase (APT) family kinase protein
VHSVSKTTISREVAQAICVDTFGLGASIGTFQELTDGFFNAAYRIELADGLRCVLKVAPPDSVRVLRYEREMMHAEVEVMRLVRERTTMPVPEIYRFDASRRLAGSPYFLMEFLPGVPLDQLRPSLGSDGGRELDRATGAYLRQVNDIDGDSFGYIAPSARRHASWREAFLHMVGNALDDGADMRVALPRPYDTLRAQVAAHAAVLDEVHTPGLVHWDLWDKNIFVDPATRRITGVIDFERALWGDALMECQFYTLEEPAGFMEGYGQPMLDTAAKRTRRVLYNIYFYLIVIIESHYRQYDAPDFERWGWQQLDQTLARLDDLAA